MQAVHEGRNGADAAQACPATTYGTLMAAAGTPLRTLQGWMGHRDYKTTEIYADFAPDPTQGAAWAERAFGSATEAEDAVERGRLF